MKKSVSCLAALAGLFLGLAPQALAATIEVTGTAAWSTLSITAADDVVVRGSGVLIVDVVPVDGVRPSARNLTIGDATTPGTVRFASGANRTIVVVQNVVFGSHPNNLLDMSDAFGTARHTLAVQGNFLQTGAGVFQVGLSTIQYEGANQTITAQIAGTVIRYNNITLSGTGTKTFQAGVTVVGTLARFPRLTLAGTTGVTFDGNLAAIEYVGDRALVAESTINTSDLEFPATVPNLRLRTLTQAHTLRVVLNGNKTITGGINVAANGASGGELLPVTLDTDGRLVVVRGSVVNEAQIAGAGTIELSGTAAQAVSGVGSFGNLRINNAAGASVGAQGLRIGGRLNIANGRLSLASTANSAALLSLAGADRANTTSGNLVFNATTDPTYFDGTGSLTLPPKPASTFYKRTDGWTIEYGTASLVITGAVARATGESYGNVAMVGDSVSITILRDTIPVLVQTVQVADNQGRFSATFNTSQLPFGAYNVQYLYVGGINLQFTNETQTGGLNVTRLQIVVTPNNKTKVFGTSDPPFDFTTSRPLLPGDGFSGNLAREGANPPQTPPQDGSAPVSELVGSYEIVRGTLDLPPSYNLTVASGRTLAITPATVTVITDSGRQKNYGSADPVLTYTYNPIPLRFNTLPQGALARAAGETVGTYAINLGTLKFITPTGAGGTRDDSYTITFIPNTFTINPRPTTIGLAEGSASKTFDAANPARYAPTFNPALVPGDIDDPDTGLTRAAGENAGNYAVSIGNLRIISIATDGAKTDKTANYALNIPAGLNFVINRRNARISATGTPAEPRNVTYGDNPTANVVRYERANDAGAFVAWPNDRPLPATLPTVDTWSPIMPIVGSLPRDYTYRIQRNAADPNYNITYVPASGDINGGVRIVKKDIVVVADSKTKIADGLVFPNSQYTVSYDPGLVAGDTPATAFTGGGVTFSGPAMTATAPGVFTINVANNYTSDKYNITGNRAGALVITEAIGTQEITGTGTWGPNESYSWTINQANGGTAGASPGWKLLRVKKTQAGAGGNLNITATATDKFTVFLSTLVPGTVPAAGKAAKFDPTRPYAWKIAEAEVSIDGFAPDKFTIVSAGGGMFANNTYGGTFSVVAMPESGTAKELYVRFTPTAQNSLSQDQVDALRNEMLSSDLDTLYLEPSSFSITPQQPVTVSLNVGNLQQPVFGAQAYLKFSSTHFIATQTGAGSPVVTPGGGVWDTAIFQLWNAGGDLDTVVLLNIGASGGTVAPGTVARVTLTPTRTTTGNSRVIFRGDLDVIQPGGAVGGTYLTGSGGVPIQPARVPTKNIGIPDDTTAPKINSIAATQVQYGSTVNVRNPATDGGPRSVRGNVSIVVNVTDLPGVGLQGPPTVTFRHVDSGATAVAKANTTGGNDGDFSYTLPIDKDTANGRWNFQVVATDSRNNTATTTEADNYIIVNKNEVQGIVQLEGFRGTSRPVTFTAGNGSAIQRTWNLTVATGDPRFLAKGEFSDLPAFAKELVQPTTAVQTSALLRYGTIGNLDNLVIRILEGTDHFAGYIRDVLFGYFVADASDIGAFHTNVALRLKAPQRAVDSYIRSRLPQETMILLNAYPAQITNVTVAQFQALNNALLIDFNDIVLGPLIWDPLRFASVVPPIRPEGGALDQILDRIEAALGDNDPKTNPTVKDIQDANRLLLAGSYLGPAALGYPPLYVPGGLNPQTAQRMIRYTGGGDATLVGLILLDLDTLAQPASQALWQEGGDPVETSLYTESRFLGVPLRPATSQLVVKSFTQTLTATEVVQLNRWLLEDGLAFSLTSQNYRAGALRPDTTFALATFVATVNEANKNALEPLLVRDLEAVRTAGTITRPQFEAAYPGQITTATQRGTYTLINVPDGVTKVAAKAAWNLRKRVDWTQGADATQGLAYFVNGEKVTGVANKHLLGGDINGSNRVDLGDFAILQANYGTVFPAADIDGNGVVAVVDYTLMQLNFNVSGDADVNAP